MKMFAFAAAALIGMAGQVSLEPDSKLWVKGDSTVRSWTCEAGEFGSVLNVVEGRDVATLVQDATITIPVADLDCNNGKMNDHMRRALKPDRSPSIIYRMKSYRIDGTRAVLYGTLTFAGTTRDIEITGTTTTENGVVRVKAETQLDMTEWGVKPPSLFLGTMKVRDQVMVGFDVALKR